MSKLCVVVHSKVKARRDSIAASIEKSPIEEAMEKPEIFSKRRLMLSRRREPAIIVIDFGDPGSAEFPAHTQYAKTMAEQCAKAHPGVPIVLLVAASHEGKVQDALKAMKMVEKVRCLLLPCETLAEHIWLFLRDNRIEVGE